MKKTQDEEWTENIRKKKECRLNNSGFLVDQFLTSHNLDSLFVLDFHWWFTVTK